MPVSEEIQQLLRAPSQQELEAELLGFLDSSYKSWALYDASPTLSSSLESALTRSKELDSKLSDSQANVDVLLKETKERTGTLREKAQDLALLRHSLADELTAVSQDLVQAFSDAPSEPTLLEDLETLHRSLAEEKNVRAYVGIIGHALELNEAAVAQVRDSSNSITAGSVQKFRDLVEFVRSVAAKCQEGSETAGSTSIQLVQFLGGIRDKTWEDMKAVLFSALNVSAESLKWPARIEWTAASPDERKAFKSAFTNLLSLQDLAPKLSASDTTRKADEGLYPLQALLQPCAARFKYHFEGSRQTNQPDKPEWYLTHVLNITHEHRQFMDNVIQDFLSSTRYRDIAAWREFTALLLTLPARKLKRAVPSLLAHPSVLAHTIYQTLAFDGSLRDSGFDLARTSFQQSTQNTNGKQGQDWEGLSEVILGRKDWFDGWLEGERKFADDQYHESISAADAWVIVVDGDGAGHSDLRPTQSARRMKALMQQVTDRYAPLPQIAHRIRFLAIIQLPLLDAYYSRLSSSLDAFETLSSAFVRAVPGALSVGASGPGRDSKALTHGVEGLQRLSKAMVSAKFILTAMEQWGDDLLFLEMWSELQRKPSLMALVPDPTLIPDPAAAGATERHIFDVLASRYEAVCSRSENTIAQHVCSEVEGELQAHFIAASSPTEPNDEMYLQPTLRVPLAMLTSQLSFLQSTLPLPSVAGLYRTIGTRLANHILQRLILQRGRAHVPARDALLIRGECELWVQTCRSVLKDGAGVKVDGPWRRLLQAGRIVGAGDEWQQLVRVTLDERDEQKWEATMADTVGYSELTRDEVRQVMRVRTDFEG